jgi:uncharacterized membrane protein YfcA
VSGTQFALVVAILVFGSFVQGLSGFGFALVAVPLVSAVVEPARAVIIVSLASFVTGVRNAVVSREQIEWPVAKRMIIAAYVAMPLGLVVLESVGPTTLRIVIGVTVGLAALLVVLGFELRQGTVTTDLTAGFVSGVLNTSTGTNGPPLVLALRARHFGVVRFRGTLAIIFIACSVVGLTLFVVRGLVQRSDVVTALCAIPLSLVAALAGDRTGQRLGDHRFDRLVILLLFASAAAAIVSAITR